MKSWKTTLVGYIIAVWTVIQPIITNGDFEIKRDWKNLVTAILVAVMGHLMKDFNATGTPTDKDNGTTTV